VLNELGVFFEVVAHASKTTTASLENTSLSLPFWIVTEIGYSVASELSEIRNSTSRDSLRSL